VSIQQGRWTVLAGLLTATCLLSLPSGAQAGRLHVGQRCNRARQQIYLRHGFTCTHHKLRRASLRQQRQGVPLLLDKDGQIQPKNALEAFDKLVAPLPGVDPRKGSVGSLDDASDVVAAVEGQRSKLTAKQRHALDQALKPGSDVATKAQAPKAGDSQAFLNLALQAVQRLSNHGFQFKGNHSVAVTFAPFPKNDDALSFVAPGWLDNVPGFENHCLIYLDQDVKGLSPAEQRLVMLTTVFRCAEYEYFDSRDSVNKVPLWVFDGTDRWVRDTVGAEWNNVALPDDMWDNWLDRPELDLGGRTFDALGFFALLAQSNVDGFQRVKDALSAAASGGDNAAYGQAIAVAPNTFFDTWGPGFVREPQLGFNWDLIGPGIPAATPPLHYPIGYGSDFSKFVDPRGAEGVALGLLADVVKVQSSAAHGRLRTSDGAEVSVHTELLCTEPDGCKCDKGKLKARQVPKGNAWLGWQGGGVSVSGTSIADECKKQGDDEPPPPPPDTPACNVLSRSGVTSVIHGAVFFSIEPPLCTYGLCEQHFKDGDQQACAIGRGATLTINKVRSANEAQDFVRHKFPNSVYHVPKMSSVSIGADVARIGKIRGQPLSSGNVVVMAKGRKVAIYALTAVADDGSPIAPISWNNKRDTVHTAKRIAKQL
jgi:hypothetical protein